MIWVRNSPRSKRQSLQFQRGGFDESPKCDGADDHTYDVHDVVAISLNLADAAALDTAVFLSGEGAGEDICDERPAQISCKSCSWRRGYAGSGCEEINEFQNKEARECAA